MVIRIYDCRVTADCALRYFYSVIFVDVPVNKIVGFIAIQQIVKTVKTSV